MMWPFSRQTSKISLVSEKKTNTFQFQTTLKICFCNANNLSDLEKNVNSLCANKHVRAIGIRVGIYKAFKYTAFISHIVRLDEKDIPREPSYTLQLRILSENDLDKLIGLVNTFTGTVTADAVDITRISVKSSINDMLEAAGVQKVSYAAFVTYQVCIGSSIKGLLV